MSEGSEKRAEGRERDSGREGGKLPKEEEDDKQITASGLDVLSTSCLIFHSARGMDGWGK